MHSLFEAIKQDDSISANDVNKSVGEAFLGYSRELPEDFEIIESDNSLIMKTGNILPASGRPLMTKDEVRELVQYMKSR